MFAEAAKSAGAGALLVATPPYTYPTGREIALHALAIDRAANLSVILYNYPGRMSVNMDEECLDRLGRSLNFCAIKESSGDPNRLHLLVRDYPHIALSCGMDEESPVTELRKPDDWVAVTPRGQVVSPRVILAVNGHLNSYGFLHGRLAHVFTYASMTRALDSDEVVRLGGKPVWSVTPADPLGTTVRRISGTGGDRIVVRNRFTFDPSLEVGERRLRFAARSHDRAFAARFPILDGVGMEFRW